MTTHPPSSDLLSAVLSYCHSQDHVHTKPCLLQVIMPPSKASSRAAGYGARQALPTPVKPLAHKAQRKEWSRTKDCNVQFRGISPRQRYQLAPALPSADMQRYRHSKQGQAAPAARNRSPLGASLHSADAPHTKPMLVVRTRAASKQHPAAAQRQVQSSSNASRPQASTLRAKQPTGMAKPQVQASTTAAARRPAAAPACC